MYIILIVSGMLIGSASEPASSWSWQFRLFHLCLTRFFLQKVQVCLHAMHGQILRLPGNKTCWQSQFKLTNCCICCVMRQAFLSSSTSRAALQACNQRVNGHANLLTRPHHLHHGDHLAQSNPPCSCTIGAYKMTQIAGRIASQA